MGCYAENLKSYRYYISLSFLFPFPSLSLRSNQKRALLCVEKVHDKGQRSAELPLVISPSQRQDSTFCDVSIAIIRCLCYLLTDNPCYFFLCAVVFCLFCRSFPSFQYILTMNLRESFQMFFSMNACAQNRTFYRELVACRSSIICCPPNRATFAPNNHSFHSSLAQMVTLLWHLSR